MAAKTQFLRNKVFILAGIMTLAVAGISTAEDTRATSDDESFLKDLSVEQREMYNVTRSPSPGSAASKPRGSGSQVAVWSDRKDRTYRIGEKVKMYIKPSKDSYVTVFNTGSSGKKHQIFPNQYQGDRFVKAGQTVEIPGKGADYDFVAGGPPGKDLVTVFATDRPGELADKSRLVASTGPFAAVSDPEGTFSKDLAVVLTNQHQNNWEGANLDLNIRR